MFKTNGISIEINIEHWLGDTRKLNQITKGLSNVLKPNNRI